jgi:hypothetical protein
VKTKDDVESRLRKLRMRYAHNHVEATQKRCFRNCEFNEAHAPSTFDYKPQLETEYEMAPRHQTTLVVMRDDRTVHLCMYGAKNPATWLGDTCDTDDKAKRCPMFKPRVSLEQARREFMEKLSDDKYVFDNFRDVAALQWVLNMRVYETPLTLFERFVFWLKKKFWKPEPALPQLPSADLPTDLWYDKGENDPPSAARS